MDEAAIEIIESIVGLEADGFLELCKCIVDLVKHHHAISSVCVVLWIFVVEANGSAEVIHCFLVMSSCHEGISSVGVIFGVGGAFIICRCRLQAGDGLAKLLDCSLSVSFILFLIVLIEEEFTLIVKFERETLLVDLIPVVGFLGLLSLGFLWLVILH